MPALHTLRRPFNIVLVLALALTAFVATTAATSGPAKAHAATLGFRAKAVEVASWQRGDPYRYGAAGPNAFDCSGLTMFAYKKVGVYLVHNARSQYYETWHKRHWEKRPGDLIFYTSNGHASGIYHVAIYAGHGWQWAAPHTGSYVHKQRIFSSHYLVGRPHH